MTRYDVVSDEMAWKSESLHKACEADELGIYVKPGSRLGWEDQKMRFGL